MSMSIVTNVNSLIAQENLRVNNDFQGRTIQRLTSGYRINSSADDAAGLAVANKFRSDVAELVQGVRNANDGLSQLQIIDGGLNNISKILDRMKTLATQAASSTFTGDRNTLNDEYGALKLEIDRQAANIGLGSGNTDASKFNKEITVYIGGGAGQANAQVSIDLSGQTSLVNSTALSLNGTSIDGSTSSVTLVAGTFDDGSKYLDQNSSQTFRFATVNGTTSVTLQGDTDGLTGNEIVTALNAGLQGTGITVSIESSSHDLVASSSASFAVAIDTAIGAGAVVSAQVTDANAVVNSGKYRFDAGTAAAVAAGEAATITVNRGGTDYTVSFSGGETKDQVVNALRAGLAGSGVDVLRIGDEVHLMSTSDFTVARSDDDAGNFLSGVTDGMAATSATDAAAASDPTSNGKTALSAIADAITYLGTVQGKVGTGQNKLQYAIQLAQSQVASFSASESRIRDADIAQEAANLTKAQVMQQASLAAMAQANSAPQAVLALLRG